MPHDQIVDISNTSLEKEAKILNSSNNRLWHNAKGVGILLVVISAFISIAIPIVICKFLFRYIF